MTRSQFLGGLTAMASLPGAFFGMFWALTAISSITGDTNHMWLMWLLVVVWPIAPIIGYQIGKHIGYRLFPLDRPGAKEKARGFPVQPHAQTVAKHQERESESAF
jgi:hypothetical protein